MGTLLHFPGKPALPTADLGGRADASGAAMTALSAHIVATAGALTFNIARLENILLRIQRAINGLPKSDGRDQLEVRRSAIARQIESARRGISEIERPEVGDLREMADRIEGASRLPS